MEKSEQINELATALALTQGAISPVKKDARNPHLKNRYATLDSVIATIKKPLSKNGLAYSQLVGRDGETTTLTTILMHGESGQYLSTTTNVARLTGNRATNDMQTLCGALTYMKRYQLSAMLGLSAEDDDDGNRGGGQKRSRKPKGKPALPVPDGLTDTQRDAFNHTTPGGKRLGEQTPAELSKMIDFANEHDDNPAAQTIKQHCEVLLDYLGQFETKAKETDETDDADDTD